MSFEMSYRSPQLTDVATQGYSPPIFSSPTQMSQLSKAAKMPPCSGNSINLYMSACVSGQKKKKKKSYKTRININ